MSIDPKFVELTADVLRIIKKKNYQHPTCPGSPYINITFLLSATLQIFLFSGLTGLLTPSELPLTLLHPHFSGTDYVELFIVVRPPRWRISLVPGVGQFREFESPECMLVKIRGDFFLCTN